MAEELTDLNSLLPEDGELSIHEIWKQLGIHGELILVIDTVEVPRLRKQLSSIKAKENSKIKSAGFDSDKSTLEFIEHTLEQEPTRTKIQIVLKKPPVVKVHKIIIPNGDLK